eukprot:Selendium_serpulae@DN10303_c0_g1_i1.p1
MTRWCSRYNTKSKIQKALWQTSKRLSDKLVAITMLKDLKLNREESCFFGGCCLFVVGAHVGTEPRLVYMLKELIGRRQRLFELSLNPSDPFESVDLPER